jgi:hypothetical protein
MTKELAAIALDDVYGGAGFGADLAYGAGRAAGWTVTTALAPFKPEVAFTQVGGPWLRSKGYPNAAAGAEQGVRDIAKIWGHPVKEQ